MITANANEATELEAPQRASAALDGCIAKHLKTFEEGLQTSKEANRQAKSWIRGHAVRRGMLSEYLEDGKMVVRSLVVSHWSLARSSLL